MTKLLELAIAEARQLPEADQDAAADALFAHMADGHVRLRPEQVEQVTRIRDDLRSGRTRLATDQEVLALWARCRA
jgi:hypothetical protein